MYGLHLPARCQGWLAAGSLVASLLLTQSAIAQDKDTLDKMRRLNEVAAQKVELDVRTAVREAYQFGQTDSAKAVECLKKAATLLDDDTALSDSRRAALKHMVKDRIRMAEADARAAEKGGAPFRTVSRRIDDAGRAAENDKVKRTVDAIRTLQREGRTEEARRLADDLARRYPDNPIAQASSRISTSAGRLNEVGQDRSDSNRRWAALTRDIDRSAQPASGDVEYPRDWKEKSKQRKAGSQLSAKEKAVLQALNTPVTIEFKESRFQDVIEYVSSLINQPIILDNAALQEAQVTYETPVTMKLKGVTVRTVLRKLLGEFNLAYIVKEETIQVTSALKAKDALVVRAYYIGDLIGNGSNLGGFLGYQINQAQVPQQVAQIIDLIRGSIDPQSWETRNSGGGPGTISYEPTTMSLVIRQSAEVHAMLSNNLR